MDPGRQPGSGNRMFFKSNKVIGLDIGTTSIKLAELSVSRNGATLESFAMVPTPAGSVTGGEIHDIASVAMAIQSVVQEAKTKTKNVSTGMWGTAVIVKKVTMPRMDKKLIKDQIRFEAEQYIPFDLSNVSLAYHELQTNASPESMDVLLIAAQNELVVQYSQAVEVAGMKCSVLDVSGFALANTFEFNYGRLPETVGLINFGSTITNFVVIQNGDVVFCRDILVGGANFTNEIHKALGVTVPEAEALKMSASAGREVPDDVHSVLSQTNEAVAEEIRNAIDFLGATTNGVSINRFYYSGGASFTPGLVDTIVRTTGIACEPLSPWMKIKGNPKKIDLQYMEQVTSFSPIALGLALRKAGDS